MINVVLYLDGHERKPYVATFPDAGQRVHVLPYLNSIYRIIVQGGQTENLFTIIEGSIHINEGPRNHYHMYEDETFYVVRGNLQFYVAGDQFCAPAGTTVYIPRNVTQATRNINSKPAYVQIVFAPSGIEDYLQKVTPLHDAQSINFTATNTLARKHGIINLPDIDWQDLNCVHDENALPE